MNKAGSLPSEKAFFKRNSRRYIVAMMAAAILKAVNLSVEGRQRQS